MYRDVGRRRPASPPSSWDAVGHLHQEPSVCLHQQEIGPQERGRISSLDGAPRKHAPEQELWTSYPLGAQEARVPDFHADSALRYTLLLRGTNSNGRFTELAYSEAAIFGQTPPDSPSAISSGSGVFPPRWHQQRSFAVVGPAGRPRSASNWSRTRPRQGVHDPLVQARCSRRAPERHLTGTGVDPLFSGPHREVPPTVVAEGERLSASGSAKSSTPTRHEPLPAARCGQPLPPPRPRPGRPASRSLSRGPQTLRAEPRQPVRLQVESLSTVQEAFFAFDTTFHSKDGKKHAARKAGRCASARGAPSQRGAGPLGAGGQHLNSQSRQSVAGAGAGTLREAGWAQECAFHPDQAVVGGHGYLHEVVSGARQDRSRVRTGRVIQGLKFVGRKAQFGPLLAVPDTPSILAGAAAPRPRREALPVPLAALAQWERWICSGSAPEHEVLIIGRLLLMVWAGLRFADAQRTCPASLLPDRHVLRSECWRTKVSRSGQPFGDLGVLQ